MFFEYTKFKFNMFGNINRIHSFKVFRRSTRFKKYNKGITKFIMNRKKYVLKKKSTSSIGKFFVPLTWAKYFSKKRQLTRFFQCLYKLDYTISLVNQNLINHTYNFLLYTNAVSKLTNFCLNSAFLSKRILTNNTLFRAQNSKGVFNFFKNTKFGVLITNNASVISSALPGGSVFYKNFFLSSALINNTSSYVLLKNNLHYQIFMSVISIVKNIRKVLILLLLLKA